MHRHISKNILHGSSFTKADKKKCVLETAQGIIGTEMPSQVRPQSTLCMMRTEDIIKDIPHPGHHLFELQVNPHMHNQAREKKPPNSAAWLNSESPLSDTLMFCYHWSVSNFYYLTCLCVQCDPSSNTLLDTFLHPEELSCIPLFQ